MYFRIHIDVRYIVYIHLCYIARNNIIKSFIDLFKKYYKCINFVFVSSSY